MRWTPEEERTALAMRDDYTAKEIARKLGRTPEMIRNFFKRSSHDVGGQKNQIASEILNEERIIIPPEVLAERERRLLAPKTLSMIIFGDPIPSQSALGR